MQGFNKVTALSAVHGDLAGLFCYSPLMVSLEIPDLIMLGESVDTLLISKCLGELMKVPWVWIFSQSLVDQDRI